MYLINYILSLLFVTIITSIFAKISLHVKQTINSKTVTMNKVISKFLVFILRDFRLCNIHMY